MQLPVSDLITHIMGLEARVRVAEEDTDGYIEDVSEYADLARNSAIEAAHLRQTIVILHGPARAAEIFAALQPTIETHQKLAQFAEEGGYKDV